VHLWVRPALLGERGLCALAPTCPLAPRGHAQQWLANRACMPALGCRQLQCAPGRKNVKHPPPQALTSRPSPSHTALQPQPFFPLHPPIHPFQQGSRCRHAAAPPPPHLAAHPPLNNHQMGHTMQLTDVLPHHAPRPRGRRPAPDILAALKARFHRLPHEELQAAAQEQMKITEQRLGALLGVPAGEQQARMQRRADMVSVCAARHAYRVGWLVADALLERSRGLSVRACLPAMCDDAPCSPLEPMRTRTRTHAHTRTRTLICTHTRTHMRRHMRTQPHTHARTHTHTHEHARTHAHAHAHTHTHMHA